jgi:RNA polymerase sigma-70 factor (sigma-E family)
MTMDAAELEQLFREQLRPMIRLAYLITLDHARAEELVQEAFTKLWHRRDRLRDADRRVAYLRSVVLNEARMLLRRRALERRRASETVGQADPAEADLHIDLMRGLARLPVRKRTVLVLRYYLDWDEATIARELGTSIGTVKSQASRGLAQLRRSMETGEQSKPPGVLGESQPPRVARRRS